MKFKFVITKGEMKMGKLERKKAIIEKYISNAAGTWPAWSYGKIPSYKLKNACYEYVGAVEPSNILGLIDITISGNGKKGMVFTEHKVYFNNGLLGSRGSVSYQSIFENGSIPTEVLDVCYNTAALRELLNGLANIEGENVQDTINDIGNAVNNGMNSVLNTINNVADTVDKAVGIFNLLSSLVSGGNDGNSAIDAVEDRKENGSIDVTNEER